MATTLTAGMTGQNVADVQRWIWYWARTLKITIPAGFMVSGTYDATTVALMKQVQSKLRLPATGVWDARTIRHAEAQAKYLKSSSIFGYLPAKNSIGEDRAFVVEQFRYLFDRDPTPTELAYRVNQLQTNQTRQQWVAGMEKYEADQAVIRTFQQMYGRDPTAAERTQWANQIRGGTATRASMADYLKGTHEYLTRQQNEATSPEQEDQRAILEQLLDEYGLGSLKDWAWQQIVSGVSEGRIIQNLRQTPEYLARFPAMANRGTAGLPAITEAEYLQYERQIRDTFRRYGLPPGFYDEPQDYAALLSADLSIDEVRSRIADGYARVMASPIEVRQAFAELYGTDGDAALATLFIDPDRGEAALMKQVRSAEAKGWGGLFGIDLSAQSSDRLADLELDPSQLRQGFGEIQSLEPLFEETISETEDLRAEVEGIEATFGTGGTGATELDLRRRQRLAAFAGGGGAAAGQEGLGVGAAE